jgi:hypothetical protein
MVGTQQVILVAALTKVPYMHPLHQPQLQTLNLIPPIILRSVPITVSKVRARMKYRPSRLLLLPSPVGVITKRNGVGQTPRLGRSRRRSALPQVRQETVQLVRQAVGAGLRPYVLVNNRSEGNAPLTVQALADLLLA